MSIVVTLGVLVGLIAMHEIGHCLFGWFLGIPRNRMSIQIWLFKGASHVALVDNSGTKVSPSEIDRYVELLEQYLPSEKKLFYYVAGGHALQFIAVLALAFVALISNMSLLLELTSKAALISLLTSTIYLVMDVLSILYRGKFSGGDFSGQWEISPFMTVVFCFIYFTGLVCILIVVRWKEIFVKSLFLINFEKWEHLNSINSLKYLK